MTLTDEERTALDAGQAVTLAASRLPGLCPTCQADLTLRLVAPGIGACAILHDGDCATYARMRTVQERRN